jgi:hypothetical protein
MPTNTPDPMPALVADLSAAVLDGDGGGRYARVEIAPHHPTPERTVTVYIDPSSGALIVEVDGPFAAHASDGQHLRVYVNDHPVHDDRDALSPQERARLSQAEALFTAGAGRGPELADEIDALRARRERGTRPRAVVLSGSPVDGLTLHGPFDGVETAIAWGDRALDCQWWAGDLHEPEGLAPGCACGRCTPVCATRLLDACCGACCTTEGPR